MSSTGTKLAEIPQGWRDALDQVRRRRSRLHYKPAALLVALDLLDSAVDAVAGRVPWGALDRSFRELLSDLDPGGSDQGWQPFFHLSTGEQLWDLFRRGEQ